MKKLMLLVIMMAIIATPAMAEQTELTRDDSCQILAMAMGNIMLYRQSGLSQKETEATVHLTARSDGLKGLMLTTTANIYRDTPKYSDYVKGATVTQIYVETVYEDCMSN